MRNIEDFLQQCDMVDVIRIPIKGDASFRSYERLKFHEKDYILMDAPPLKENVRPFIKMDKIYINAGYSVPKIIASNIENGYLLLEDFGDTSFSNILKNNPELEMELYIEASNLLADKYNKFKTNNSVDIPNYSKEILRREFTLFGEYYLDDVMIADKFMTSFEDIMQDIDLTPETITHRDFHADNLFWLEDRLGINRVGMIDFQDALLGRSAYDMVSLLEDARRDVSAKIISTAIDNYIDKTNKNHFIFTKEYLFFAMQRNAKILGIFMRLAERDGKKHYLSYIPRVLKNFKHNLELLNLSSLLTFI